MSVLISGTPVNVVEEGHPQWRSDDIRTNREPDVRWSTGKSIRRR